MSDVPLKEHIETQITLLDRYFDTRLDAVRAEIHKAESQLAIRLESMNEFRETLKDQTAGFITKDSFEAEKDAVNGRLSRLEISEARAIGIAAGVSFVISLAAFFLTKIL